MKDFAKFLGLGGGIGIAVAMWRLSERIDTRIVETLLAVFVTGIVLSLIAIAVAIAVSKLGGRNFNIEREMPRESDYRISAPDASKVFASGVPAGYLPPVAERKWEFKDGSEDHIGQLRG